MDLDAEHTDQQHTNAAGGILHRKVAQGRAVHQARAVSLPKALRVTVAKVADELFDMAMAVIGARVADHMADDLAEVLDVPGLMLLLEGPARRRAAAVLDPVFVGGLIQQQTMGQVMADLGGSARKMTATDAAISAPFLDMMLERAAALPEAPEERAALSGFHVRSHVEDARLLQMALDDHEYRVIHLTVDMAGGARQGKLTLVMPLGATSELEAGPGRGQGHAGTAGRRKAEDDAPASPPRNKMSDTVMALDVNLVVALAQLKLPLNVLSGLRVGDTLDLGVIAFDGAKVLTEQGKIVGRGSVGQVDGMRALKMARKEQALAHPMRRVTDIDQLDLPNVSGDGLGLGREDKMPAAAPAPALDLGGPEALPDMSDLPDLDLPDLPNLPDVDDPLPGVDLPEVTDLPDLGGGPEGLDLPDLPDLPELDLPDLDLPDLDLPDLDLPDLPDLNVA